ncbi:hypothetical protein NKJ84_19455 [Mesorhizobium sp. M0048]|uniref:hypothetical protein n=1 Tax=Mesorhizobium sp. M0048 TaxID=2956860 RepID=UPI00333BB079
MAKVTPPNKSAIASATKLKGSASDFGERYRREEDLRPTAVMLDIERRQLSDQAASSWLTQTQLPHGSKFLERFRLSWNR